MINACPYLKRRAEERFGNTQNAKIRQLSKLVDILSHNTSHDRELDLISSANQEAPDVTDKKKCENSPKRVVIKSTQKAIKV